jgi:two-component system sensor histidine kinase QseC
MKLLTITIRYFLSLVVGLLFIWFVVIYFSVNWIVYHDLDEYLENREKQIIETFKLKFVLLNNDSLSEQDYVLKEITKEEYSTFKITYPQNLFAVIERYDDKEDDDEPFRTLESVFENGDNHYSIIITAPLIESEELLYVILIDMGVLFVFIVCLIIILNNFFLKKLWNPFYINLLKIKNYHIDKDVKIELQHSGVSEFEEFRMSIEELIENSRQVYINQKEFTENASHEIQTPLTVAQNKLHQLIEQPELSNESARLLEITIENLDKLSRLSKTLLLLSKIENKQFSQVQEIDISDMVVKTIEELRELIEYKNISVTIHNNGPIKAQSNMQLAEILISNIIVNSIHHNINNGKIEIELSDNSLTIKNTGKELQVDASLMFERFKKKSTNNHSVGLGLSIVKSICNISNFSISYTYQDNIHTIRVQFQS